MNDHLISELCLEYFDEKPNSIERCLVGHGNFVYIVECKESKYVIRCSKEDDAYENSIYWLEQLAAIEIPVPTVIGKGTYNGYEYVILSYIAGYDIGNIYSQLNDNEKRTIAKEIVSIQDKVAELHLDEVDANWSWYSFIEYMLERAKERIAGNGYFDVEKVERLYGLMESLETYFSDVKPIAYLDDISSKNLLIHNGQISGIIDIDWIGIGDKLTYVALTNIALLNLEYDTDYVKYIFDKMQVSEAQYKAFLFYSLMYCVDFMGERGMTFMDKTIEVNKQIIDRLNGIYDMLWNEFMEVV